MFNKNRFEEVRSAASTPRIGEESRLRKLKRIAGWQFVKAGAAAGRGFTLIEAAVTLGVFSLGLLAVLQLNTVAKATSEQGRNAIQASNYLQEGLEAVRAIRDNAWSNVTTNGSYRLVAQPSGSNPAWQLQSGGSESVAISNPAVTYTRTVTIAGVRRSESSGNLALSAGDTICQGAGCGAYDDPDTRLVTVTVTWPQGSRTISRSLFTYLTNWQ